MPRIAPPAGTFRAHSDAAFAREARTAPRRSLGRGLERESAATVADAALRIAVTAGADRSPLAGARARVEIRRPGAPTRIVWTTPTGADGISEMSDLPTGEAQAVLDVGAVLPLARPLCAGETAELRFHVEGQSWSGVVTDLRGAAVRGAKVYAQCSGVVHLDRPLAETDDEGRFTVHGMTAGRSLVAVHDEYVASDPVGPASSSGTPGSMLLRLGPRAPATIRWRWVGSTQALDPDARVLLRMRSTDPGPIPEPSFESPALPAGAFPGLWPGAGRLELRSAHLACRRASFTCRAGDETTVALDVGTSCGLEGRVLHSGAGVRALVRVLGSDGAAIAFESREDGTFTVEGLPGGDLTVTARHAVLGMAEVALSASSAAPALAELHLDPEPAVRGRVLDQEDAPVQALRVTLGSADDPFVWEHETRTDEHGAFVFPALPAHATFELQARADGPVHLLVPLARRSDVVPGATEHLLRVDRGQLDFATLEGRVTPLGADAATGRFAAKVTATDEALGRGWTVAVAPDGGFELTPLPPRVYALTVRGPWLLEESIRITDLAPGETSRAPELRPRVGGRIEVLHAETPSGSGAVWQLRPPPGSGASRFLESRRGRVEAGPFAPGEYGLEGVSAGVRGLRRTVHVAAGETTTVVVE